MLKKLLTTLLFCLLITLRSLAQEDVADVRAFFDEVVAQYNSYSTKTISNFADDAQIIRVVIKPDGSKESVKMSKARYKMELAKGLMGARVVNYKNSYSHIDIAQIGDEYRLSAIRTPNKGGGGLPCHYIIVKTAEGYKIKTESWETKQQGFLRD